MIGKEQIDDGLGLRVVLGLFFGGAAGLALAVAMGTLFGNIGAWVLTAPPAGAVLGLVLSAAGAPKAERGKH
jgi:hypothetical protein